LDPDVRGATSIREQLSKHRETATCYDCHRKIDPLGFALENFNAVGQWRDQYEDKLEIDSSGELPSGESFNDIVEFKNAILGKQELFSRALTNKILSYALGRRLEITDRPEVDRILDTLAEEGNGFRDLVYLVITSEAFGSP
jgi:pantothenate kinase-related protein Tda10